MKKILLFSLISVILVSCGTSNSVVNNGLFQKRKYTSGWFVKKNKQHQKTEAEEEKIAFVQDIKTIKHEEVSNSSVSAKEGKSTLKLLVDSKENTTTSLANDQIPTDLNTDESVVKSITLDNSLQPMSTSTTQEHESTADKKLIKNTKEEDQSNNLDDTMLILLVILAFLIPPLAVWLAAKDTTQLIISIILTLLFWLPGIIHALLVVFGVI